LPSTALVPPFSLKIPFPSPVSPSEPFWKQRREYDQVSSKSRQIIKALLLIAPLLYEGPFPFRKRLETGSPFLCLFQREVASTSLILDPRLLGSFSSSPSALSLLQQDRAPFSSGITKGLRPNSLSHRRLDSVPSDPDSFQYRRLLVPLFDRRRSSLPLPLLPIQGSPLP